MTLITNLGNWAEYHVSDGRGRDAIQTVFPVLTPEKGSFFVSFSQVIRDLKLVPYTITQETKTSLKTMVQLLASGAPSEELHSRIKETFNNYIESLVNMMIAIAVSAPDPSLHSETFKSGGTASILGEIIGGDGPVSTAIIAGVAIRHIFTSSRSPD